MCDADLDALGREDFFITSHRLRLELVLQGEELSLRDWYVRQLEFVQSHVYWTLEARNLRDKGKRQNIAALTDLLYG